MKIALLSDIHGNYPALKACLDFLDKKEVDRYLCLGDVVGYGPYPDACVQELRQRQIPMVMGNHDAAVVGRMPYEAFRGPNRSILEQTADLLSPENRDYLEAAPLELEGSACEGTPQAEYEFIEEASEAVHGSQNGVHHPGPGQANGTHATEAEDEPGDSEQAAPPRWKAVHASPIKPEDWTYLESATQCRSVLAEISGYDFIFAGHTHKPAIVAEELGVFGLKKGYRYLINPGSVGQPRDGDPRASIGILDLDTYFYQNKRIEYDIRRTLDGYEKMGIRRKRGKKLLHLKKKRKWLWG